MAAQLDDTGAKMSVTAAPANMGADDALRRLGIVLGERDQHVHIRKFTASEQVNLDPAVDL
ncbi:MAG: hypothetical protein U1E33_02635 [Rhodospirillales bacterium]